MIGINASIDKSHILYLQYDSTQENWKQGGELWKWGRQDTLHYFLRFIDVKGRATERGRDRQEEIYNHLLTTQMATEARAESDWSQEPRAPSWPSVWVAETQVLEPLPTVSQGTHVNKKMESKTKAWGWDTPVEDTDVPTGSSTARPNTTPIFNFLMRLLEKITCVAHIVMDGADIDSHMSSNCFITVLLNYYLSLLWPSGLEWKCPCSHHLVLFFGLFFALITSCFCQFSLKCEL